MFWEYLFWSNSPYIGQGAIGRITIVNPQNMIVRIKKSKWDVHIKYYLVWAFKKQMNNRIGLKKPIGNIACHLRCHTSSVNFRGKGLKSQKNRKVFAKNEKVL